jgi:rsbT co-antagonist protein RsbR
MTQGEQEGSGGLEAEVAELRRRVEELSSLFGAMGDVVVEIDWDGRVLRAAPTRPDPTHALRPEHVGSKLHDVLPAGRADEILSSARGAMETGGPVGVELTATLGDQGAWFMGTAWPSSNTTSVIALRDVTERRQIEEAMRVQQDDMIRAQSAALAELSTPLIPISEDIVVMPLIGLLDSQRAQQVMTTLLEGISKTGAAVAILDITGVSVVDTQVANGLIRAARAAALLGAEVVLTGIRPEVARTLVGLGADLQDIVTRGTLQSGITYAMERREEREAADDEDEEEDE